MPVDDMTAARLISMMADGQFRHVTSRKAWYCWNGRYHEPDTTGWMHRVIQSFAATYWQALQIIEAQAKEKAQYTGLAAGKAARQKGGTDVRATDVTFQRIDQVMKRALGFLSPQFRYGKQLLNDPVQERV